MLSTKILAAALAVVSLGLISNRSLAESGATSGGCAMGLSDEISSTLFALVDFAEEARPHVHREEFELEARLDKLDYDATQILQFVSEWIAFEPYPGLLRGATGTLMSRGGNSIDQAVLLATLLRDAGFEARISQGELSPGDARKLVAMLIRPLPAADPWDEDGMREAQKRYSANARSASAASATPDTPETDQLLLQAKAERAFIVRQLKDAGVRLGVPKGLNEMVEEARTYFWVEYRLGPSEAWRQAHPAFGSASAPEVEALATFGGKIPEELTHRIRLEVLVDQRLGDRLATNPLIDPIEAPSANLVGRPLRLTLVPDQLLLADAAGEPEFAKTRFLIPFFNADLPAGAKVLSIDGTLIPPEALNLGAADLFQELSSKTNAAASALNNLDSPSGSSNPDLMALSSVRLVVTLLAPDGSETTSERVWFDASESQPTDRATGSLAMSIATALARSDEVFVAAGDHPPGFVLDSMLAWFEESRTELEALQAAALTGCDSLACLPMPSERADASQFKLATIFSSLEWIWKDRPEIKGFRDEPGVVILTEALAPGPNHPEAVIDIVSNGRRVFKLRGSQISLAPEEVILGGVWESLVEERLLPGDSGADSSAASEIRRQVDNGLPLAVVTRRARNPRLLASIGGPARRLLDRDLESGYLALVAQGNGDSAASPMAWWRVNPDTGEVLAMARYGGQAVREYRTIWRVWNGQLIKLLRGRPMQHCVQLGTGSSQVLSCAWCDKLPPAAGIGWVRATAGIGAVGHSGPFTVFSSVETPLNRCTLEVIGSEADGGGGPGDSGGGGNGPGDSGGGGGGGPGDSGGGGGGGPGDSGGGGGQGPPGPGEDNDPGGDPGDIDTDVFEICCENEQGEIVDCRELEEGEGQLVECR